MQQPQSLNARYTRLLIGVAAAMLLLVAFGLWSAQKTPQKQAQTPLPIAVTTSSPTVAVAPTSTKEAPKSPVIQQEVVAAVITKLKGNATVTQNGKTVKAFLKMKLASGDIVEVSPTGTLAITWTKYGRTILSGGTRLVVSAASVSADAKTLRVRLNLEAGRVWTRLQRLLTADSSFEIRAQNVVATVRGTSFGVAIEKNKKIKIQVMESTVGVAHVKDVKDAEEVVGVTVVVAPKEEVVVPVWLVSAEVETPPIPSPQAMTAVEIRDPFVSEGHQEIQQEELEVVIPTMMEIEIESEAEAAEVVNAIGLEPIVIQEQQPALSPKLIPTPRVPVLVPKPKQSTVPSNGSDGSAQKTKTTKPTDDLNIEDYLVKDPNAQPHWATTSTKP